MGTVDLPIAADRFYPGRSPSQLAVAALAVVGLVLLAGSGASFIANFNHFWQPVTGQADTHAAVVKAATDGGFVEAPRDLYWTLIPITWIYLELVFNQASAYIGGEVKRASRIQLWSMPIAAIASVAVAIVLTALLQGVLGTTTLGALGWDPYLADASILKQPYPMPFTEIRTSFWERLRPHPELPE